VMSLITLTYAAPGTSASRMVSAAGQSATSGKRRVRAVA
jgi:hypothetical protein